MLDNYKLIKVNFLAQLLNRAEDAKTFKIKFKTFFLYKKMFQV